MTRGSRDPVKVADARAFLITCINKDAADLPTYGDVGALIGCRPLNVSPVLLSVFDECMARGEPDLTLLVVNQTTRLPGDGASMEVSAKNPSSIRRWARARQDIAAWTWSP